MSDYFVQFPDRGCIDTSSELGSLKRNLREEWRSYTSDLNVDKK